jgi:hypothetical protein
METERIAALTEPLSHYISQITTLSFVLTEENWSKHSLTWSGGIMGGKTHTMKYPASIIPERDYVSQRFQFWKGFVDFYRMTLAVAFYRCCEAAETWCQDSYQHCTE